MEKRGYLTSDQDEFFCLSSLELLQYAQQDIAYLTGRGYPIDQSITMIGNHFKLSARQRMAVVRSTSGLKEISLRRSKCTTELKGKTVLVDGFNIIITLETMLAGSTLLYCMDGAIRDLCGLRGTYRMVEQTDEAIKLMFQDLKMKQAKKIIIYLDQPISNSGKLKQRIGQIGDELGVDVRVTLDFNPDALLWGKDNVITSDAMVLNRCLSWYNMTSNLLKSNYENIVNLSGNNEVSLTDSNDSTRMVR